MTYSKLRCIHIWHTISYVTFVTISKHIDFDVLNIWFSFLPSFLEWSFFEQFHFTSFVFTSLRCVKMCWKDKKSYKHVKKSFNEHTQKKRERFGKQFTKIRKKWFFRNFLLVLWKIRKLFIALLINSDFFRHFCGIS